MARERGQKKSFQQSLEGIKEKMKEKRTKRLASVSAPRGHSKMINKKSAHNSRKMILESIQLNNKSLALAVQAEKEKVRQANGLILQLKREQQALFIHLLLLKRKLKEQEAMAKNKSDPTKISAESLNSANLSGETRKSPNLENPHMAEDPNVSQDPLAVEGAEIGSHFTLPTTVSVRRRQAESCSRRRSERVHSFYDGNPVNAAVEPILEESMDLTARPIHSDCGIQSQAQPAVKAGPADPLVSEKFQHSTTEPDPAKSTNQQQPRRKQAKQQPQTKPDPAGWKPERGRKPERAPLKKHWENAKPRTRSKSRDRSTTRVGAAAPPQADKLNASLGFNDTFDFDCEETVHLAPFRAKAEGIKPETPVREEVEGSEAGRSPVPVDSTENESGLSSEESEGSPYVPQRTGKRRSSPEQSRTLPSRRRLPVRVGRSKENIPIKHHLTALRDKDSDINAVTKEMEELPCPESPDWMFTSSPAPLTADQDNHSGRDGEDLEEDGLLTITPGMEAEMMRIDSVLSSFTDCSADAPPIPPCKTPRETNANKRRGFGVRPAGRGLSLCDVTNLFPAARCKAPIAGSRRSEVRCSTPAVGRKRRCTMAVDYKEPSLNAKLRRGDKFTDLQFLSSPVFKRKSGRMSAQRRSQQSLEKYEPFVGCR